MNSPENELRREFIKQSGTVALGLSLASFVPGTALAKAPGNAKGAAAAYAGWEDVYRRIRKWDKVKIGRAHV